MSLQIGNSHCKTLICLLKRDAFVPIGQKHWPECLQCSSTAAYNWHPWEYQGRQPYYLASRSCIQRKSKAAKLYWHEWYKLVVTNIRGTDNIILLGADLTIHWVPVCRHRGPVHMSLAYLGRWWWFRGGEEQKERWETGSFRVGVDLRGSHTHKDLIPLPSPICPDSHQFYAN